MNRKPLGLIPEGLTEEQQDIWARNQAAAINPRRETEDERYEREVREAREIARAVGMRTVYDSSSSSEESEVDLFDEIKLTNKTYPATTEEERNAASADIWQQISQECFENHSLGTFRMISLYHVYSNYPNDPERLKPPTAKGAKPEKNDTTDELLGTFLFECIPRNKLGIRTKKARTGKRDDAARILFIEEDYNKFMEEFKLFRYWCTKKLVRIYNF